MNADIGPFLWHGESAHSVCARLDTDISQGLDPLEADQRLKKFGFNRLEEGTRKPFWKEFLEELREPLVLMLLATSFLYALWGEVGDAIVILCIILAMNTIEVINEQRSHKAIESLHKLAEPTALVRRGGRFLASPLELVVPGDLIFLQEGHRVPADARLVEALSLSIDESALTGESVPVEKYTQALPGADIPLAERNNMVYSSTLVTRGRGTALVVGTGMETEIGRITGMTRKVKEPRTHLQKMMAKLAKTLMGFALGFSLLIPMIGILIVHLPFKQMVLTGLSLAYATIPEELPIMITMVLSLGAFRLSKKHAITRRLSAVETLGSVTVIATDKTGTLTQNRMETVAFQPIESRHHLLELGLVCNNAFHIRGDFKGDPMDLAILQEAGKSGLRIRMESHPVRILEEYPFDNDRKRMSMVYIKNGWHGAAVKGAPESILGQCAKISAGGKERSMTGADKEMLLDRVNGWGEDGLRVLAFAERRMEANHRDREEAESGLTFIGLVGFRDPLRPDAASAIASCQRAGIRTVMITGDHPHTALAVAREVNLAPDLEVMTGQDLDKLSPEEFKEAVQRVPVFARTTPEHKFRIVEALQEEGERVAVTGDGVNDAPSLSLADIGVAMGETGTDVAREAGALVITDDKLSTIVNAVEEGRLIFENLKKGVRYYLACKLALLLINLIPILLLVPVPFSPIQIILMELFMDLMAAAAFVTEKAESDLLDQKPRDQEARFMDKGMMLSIFSSSLGLFGSVTLLYLLAWHGTHDLAFSQTTAFISWLVGHVLLAFNLRSEHQPILQMGLLGNRMMVLWAGAVALFISLGMLFPAVQRTLHITLLPTREFLWIFAATAMGTFWMEIKKALPFFKKDRPYRGHQIPGP